MVLKNVTMETLKMEMDAHLHAALRLDTLVRLQESGFHIVRFQYVGMESESLQKNVTMETRTIVMGALQHA